eukprot:UN21604
MLLYLTLFLKFIIQMCRCHNFVKKMFRDPKHIPKPIRHHLGTFKSLSKVIANIRIFPDMGFFS